MPRTPSRRPDRARYLGGRHELGQNLLIDKRFPAMMTEILRHAPPLPILELGAGDGAVTAALVAAGLSVTVVEIDPRAVTALRRRFGRRVQVVEGDMLTYDHGPRAHHVMSNVPFGITTPVLRRLLPAVHWNTAVLLVQWEVARKRAGIGGTTLLTATWWPWYEFSLAERVPAAAFRPVPAVDGGILVIRRREDPLLAPNGQRDYQRLVRQVFTGPGHGLAQILQGLLPRRTVARWLAAQRLSASALPRDMIPANWISLYQLSCPPPASHFGRTGPDGGSHHSRG